MGRKTLESFPGGQPLKKRTNIVLTSDRSYQAGEAVIVHSMEELMEELEKYPGRIFLSSGGERLQEPAPLVQEGLCDADGPRLRRGHLVPGPGRGPGVRMTKTSDEQTYFDLEYYFTVYERIAGGK